MAGRTNLIKINPAVVKWIIDDSGLNTAELAEKIQVAKPDIDRWRTSNAEIEIKKLERLSKAVKRPITVFFLPHAPEESEVEDYRRLPGEDAAKLAPDTRLQIRYARYLQEVAGDLMRSQRIEAAPKATRTTIQSSPEKIAAEERKKLGFESDEPSLPGGAKKPEDLYAALRQMIESFNVFVMQASMPVNEVRAMTLSGKIPAVIVISSKDRPAAKTFSLLHEYGHVLLRKGGMCVPQIGYAKNPGDVLHVERWCNRFAASVLMPEGPFLKQRQRLEESGMEKEGIIGMLASRFKASKLAVAVRMRDLGQGDADAPQYDRLLQKIKNSERAESVHGTGGPEIARLCVSRKGKKFISLVLESESNNIINISDVSDYLGIKIKHLKRLEEEAL